MLNALRVVKIALIGPVATHATERIIIQKLKRWIQKFSKTFNGFQESELWKKDDIKCYKKNLEQFDECGAACDIDFVCLNDCYLDLAENNKLCPCDEKCPSKFINRYRRKRPKVDASIFDSALSHTRRSEASEKKRRKNSRPLLVKFACGQVSSPRLYRLRYFTSLII